MMVNKKKKQSRSQSSTEKKTPEPNLLSIFHSKLANGKDSKHMLRGMSSKPTQGLSSQSRVVRCPKCHKFLQEPIDVTVYKCSGCNSLLQAQRWELENNDKDLLSSSNRSLSTEVESAEGGSKTPVRSTYRKYSSRASPCFERGYDSETAYKRHETSYIHREWMTRAASARSCSGAVKSSITKNEDTTLLDLLRFVDSDTSFAEKTVVIHHQDSASDSHLSSSDNGSGDTRSISSEICDLKLEAFQPSLDHKLREQQQQPASRIHLEKSEEESGGGSKTPVRSSYRKYSSRASPLSERGHQTSYIRREWMRSASPSPSSYGYTSPFHGSQFSKSERSYHQPNQFKQYGREGWSQELSSSGAASPIRFQGETSDQKCYHGSSQQSQLSITKKEDTLLDLFRFVDSRTSVAEETVMHGHLSSSDNGSGDRICTSTDVVILQRNLETIEDKGIKEDIRRRSISSKFYDLKLEAFQPQWKPGSSETIGETSRIHQEKSEEAHCVEPLKKKEHVCETNVLSENTRDTQEFDLGELKWEDITGDKPVLEKSQYIGDSICHSSSSNGEMYEDTVVVKEDKTHISNQSFIDQSSKATVTMSKIPEEQSKHDEYENISERQDLDKTNSDRVRYELEDVRLETVHASERPWAETTEDRAGLHYSNPFEWTSEEAATFHMHEYELGTILKFRRPESSSRGSFSDHESSEESDVIWEFQEAKPDQFQNEISSESSNTVLDIVRSELHEGRHETTETFEQGKMVRVGSVVSLGKASETIIGKTDEEQLISHQMAPQNENIETSYRTVEPDHLERSGYASERTWTETVGAPTLRLHEKHELGTMSEPEEDVSGRSISSSKKVFDDHGSSKERALAHEEESWLVNENKIEELKAGVMMKDGPSLHLEKCGYESKTLEETFGLTESTPVFCLHEPELGTLLEPDNEADGSSESSSTGSFNSHESSKLRAVFHQEEPQVMSDSRTEMLSVKLEEIFEWTSVRAPTFRLYEPELGALLEPDRDAYRRSESSSRGFFNDHVTPKEREIDHGEDEDEPWLVDDYETKPFKGDVMAEDGPSPNVNFTSTVT